MKYLNEKGANISAQDNQSLIRAAENGHLKIVQFLADKGANIQDQNNRALYKAAWHEYLEVVKFLLKRGARDQDYKALVDLTVNHLENETWEAIIKCLLEYFYPRDLIESLLTKVSDPKLISLLRDYLNQKFLISPQDQRLLEGDKLNIDK